jgi:hypothetical protein
MPPSTCVLKILGAELVQGPGYKCLELWCPSIFLSEYCILLPYASFFLWPSSPIPGHGPPPLMGFRDHTHWTARSAGLLWASDQPDAETPT